MTTKFVIPFSPPFLGPDTIYGDNTDAISSVVNEYISANDLAIQKFLDALKDVAEAVANPASDPTGKKADLADYSEAAATIFTADLNSCTGRRAAQYGGKI